MSSRNYPDWLKAFCDYAKYGEAPTEMYFWVGVSAVAGALRRRVWIDQTYFKWYPNFYVILVAPPGIVSKSTTAGVAMNLLRRVPGIKFGPDVVTWQALVSAFSESTEGFDFNDEYHIMSPLTIESSEFGNLLNPQDKEMVDLLVSLWDGKQGSFEKRTKMSGNDKIENPWINLVACTTPSWIAQNFPEYMIGGGFVSRCIFVYAEEKHQYVAYPGQFVPEDIEATSDRLVQDLEHIAVNITGEYKLTRECIKWGEEWYHHHYTHRPAGLADDRFGGYIARKQTHIHKLAMVIAAATRDDLVIEAQDLLIANEMVTSLEVDMPKVFSKIGRSDLSFQTDRLLDTIIARGVVTRTEANKLLQPYLPKATDIDEVINGLLKAGLIAVEMRGTGPVLRAAKPPSTETTGQAKSG